MKNSLRTPFIFRSAWVLPPIWEWFWQAVSRYPLRSTTIVCLSILISLADGLSVSLLIPFLSALFEGAGLASGAHGPLTQIFNRATEWAGPGNELFALSCAIFGLVSLRAIFSYIETVMAGWISGQISCELRSRIHQNLLRTDFEYICVNDNARLLNTLDSETWNATEAITTFFYIFSSLCMVIVFTTILFLISWQLTFLVFALLGAVSTLMLLFNKKLRVISTESVVAAEELSERAVELLDGMRMIRAFGREPQAQARYDDRSRRLFNISMRSDRLRGKAGMLREILYAIVFVVVVFAGLAIEVGGAPLIAFLALLHRMQPHVRAIDNSRMHLVSLTASVRAVSELLSLPHWDAKSGGGIKLQRLQDSIHFENVTFAYAGKDREQRNALDNITLDFPIGKVTAVVGWSGAGKSTLTNLLFRFYDPDAGSVGVDGVPLGLLDLSWWRGQLAIAGQDADLLGGTIADNIAYGKDGATSEEVVAAAKGASAHEFIMALPHNYETRVGGRGVLLSGGQRQRIGLARALIRGNGVLVLDEATNSLDSLTEYEILKTLEKLRGRVTVIVIAHRLSTTRLADQVAVLSEGRVVEFGAPDALLRRNGLYTKMVQLQELFGSSDRIPTLADSV